MKRYVLILAFVLGALCPLHAQTLDSVRVDSTTHYSTAARSYFTSVQTIYDTVSVPAPLPTGVDLAVSGDTSRFTFWHTGRIDDSVKVVVAAPSIVLGKPFGPSSLLDAATSAPFTYSGSESAQPGWIVSTIDKMRARGIKGVLALPCGGHSPTSPGYCLTQGADGVWRFDRAKFNARIALYDTPEIKAAVAKATADGVVQGISLIDEPWVSGGNDGSGAVVGNTWGPPGTLTKVRVDSLCAVAQKLFPGTPSGTVDNASLWDPSHDMKVCDFGLTQFSYRMGSVTAWRDSALAMGTRGGYRMIFSFNPVNGGTQDRDGLWDCWGQGGVKGQSSPNCSMTGAQIANAVQALGDAGCAGLMMWRYDATRFALPAWVQAFKDAAALQARRAQKPCGVRVR